MRTLLVCAAPLLALAITGCGSRGGTDEVGADPTAPAASGEYDGEWVARELPGRPGAPELHLTLEDGRIAFTAGCNSFSGLVDIDGGRFDAGSMGGTEMGCPDGGELDEWLVGFLDSADTIERGTDGLTIGGEGTEIRLVPVTEEPPAAPEALEAGRWLVTGISEIDDGLASMTGWTARREAWLEVAGGELHYSDGCNTGGGPVTVERGVLRVGDLAGTARGCPGGDAIDELLRQRLADVLAPGVVEWSVEDDQLRLRRKTGPGTEVEITCTRA